MSPHTSFELTFEDRRGYLYACVKADTITDQLSEEYQRRIAERVADSSVERLMIFRDIPAVLSTPAAYFAANRLIKMLPSVKIAFVNPYASNEKVLHFATTVGSNFGEHHEVFNDVDKAERWLLAR